MSFIISQSKGIHEVTEAPERVWVGRWWSIEVPVGYTYSVDPEKAGGGPSGKYQLHIQESKSGDFSMPYSSDFNVIVYDGCEAIGRNCDDMSKEEIIETLDNLGSHFLGEYQVYKCSKDLIVLYNVAEESEKVSSYDFQVVVRGWNLVSKGNFRCYTGTKATRSKNILQWLDTIDVLTQDERLNFVDFSGTAKSVLPTKYSEEKATIDDGIQISIPYGFHAETDTDIIGEKKRLVIVPENYSFSSDPAQAPVALFIQSAVMRDVPTNVNLIDKMFEILCDHGIPFQKNSIVGMYKNTDKAFVITQSFISDDNSAGTFSFLFVNNVAYAILMTINYSANEFDSTLAQWDMDHLANAWLARIQVDGETIPEYPSRNPSSLTKKSINSIASATPLRELYPHYHYLGDTSVPKTINSNVVMVTNEGGTEFESYPLSEYDGELTDVIKRVISYDDCSKEYKELTNTAIVYATLFRVDKSVFNLKEDRECDIRNLRMRRAYQLHVLRSFAWSIAEQAETQQKDLSDFDVDDYQKVFSYISQRKYLNYRDESHFPTLCGTADLHVYFVPDQVTKTDKNALLDSSEGDMIPVSVASLNGLRKDLLELSETMEKIFQWLLRTRDYSKPLNGPEADALYAWCTMVLSAETPFYIEDGPMMCFYDQITEPSVPVSSPIAPSVGNTPKHTGGVVLPIKECVIFDEGILEGYVGHEKDIIIPDDFAGIGSSAFAGKEITSVVIPKGVKSIGDGAFSYCKKLTRIELPSSLRKIEDQTFMECEQLVAIIIPEGCEEIGEQAFDGCKKLRHVYISDSVREIGKFAFFGCNKVIIHTERGSAADRFAQENYIKVNYEYPPSRDIYSISANNHTSGIALSIDDCEIDEDGVFYSYDGDEKDIILPDGITSIDSFAFDSQEVTSVVIPEGVTHIGDNAFSQCQYLTNVVLPDSLVSIGEFSFWECSKLINIVLPNTLKTIGTSAFNNCNQLTTIIIPEDCEVIGKAAFWGCENLKDVYISGSVRKIEEFAFDPCNVTIHTERGSVAEQYAKENILKVDYEYPYKDA